MKNGEKPSITFRYVHVYHPHQNDLLNALLRFADDGVAVGVVGNSYVTSAYTHDVDGYVVDAFA
jgi:hypothetical protein